MNLLVARVKRPPSIVLRKIIVLLLPVFEHVYDEIVCILCNELIVEHLATCTNKEIVVFACSVLNIPCRLFDFKCYLSVDWIFGSCGRKTARICDIGVCGHKVHQLVLRLSPELCETRLLENRVCTRQRSTAICWNLLTCRCLATMHGASRVCGGFRKLFAFLHLRIGWIHSVLM